MYQFVNVIIQNGIATLTLQRPEKCNALNRILIQELFDALQKLTKDPAAEILILQGSGKHFCAGADIQWLRDLVRRIDKHDSLNQLADLLHCLYHFSKPTIALAQGAVRGGGLGFLAACDIVIAAQETTFAFSEVKIGVTPSIISPYILAAIGERATRYYFLTGKVFNTKIACALGLVHHVVNQEDLLSIGIEQAKELLHNSPLAMQEVKNLLLQVNQKTIPQELCKKTAAHLIQLQTTREAQEGLNAFIEKRSPHWIK